MIRPLCNREDIPTFVEPLLDPFVAVVGFFADQEAQRPTLAKRNGWPGLERHFNSYGFFSGFFSASWRACSSFRHFAASSGLFVAS